MSDSTPDDSPAPAEPLTAEQAAAIESAKPLAPRPRPAFTRKASAAAKPQPAADLSDIPEAVPLDDIPEGIPLTGSTVNTTTQRPPGNRPVRPKQAPRNRVTEVAEPEPVPEKAPIDKTKFADFDKYEKGEIKVKPLDKLPGVESRQVQRLDKPKFLDGELPRTVERGVQYPLPGRVLFTSVILLIFKLLLFVNVIGLTGVALFAPDVMGYAIWGPIALIIFGLMFVISANRTRCRICSCHMFYNRRCFKHQKAHRLFGFGHAGSAALHAILFKWLRCMYCGTAIRLRPAKEDSEEAEQRRAAEAQKPDYDKSLIKPRPPR